MTTKTKAKKFRIRRNAPLGGDPARRPAQAKAAAAAAAASVPADDLTSGQPLSPVDDGFADQSFPTAAAQITAPDEVTAETAIAGIRKEGLTGRQLRMARRIAQKHGLPATSDFDAVRLLRKKGIDPFQRANMLELVVPKPAGDQQSTASGVPKTVPKPQLPSTEVHTEDTRAREIVRMQRDIVKRRRRKLLQLASRLGFFVMLPTFMACYYYFNIATPMYSTKSEFVIQQAQPSVSGASGLSSLFSGTSLATSQDSIAVQGYLQSLDAMLRLNTDVGFTAHFSQPHIDALQRLELDATKESAYKVFKKNVKISYDPTEGIIKMEVIAADPVISQQFAERLILYAEEQVDNLTRRLRADQMQGARESFEEAEAKMMAAQQSVLELQERLGVLDPAQETGAIMAQVTAFETQLQQKRLQLQQLLDNTRPNRARVEGTRGDIRRLEALIAQLRAQLTENSAGSTSLASIAGQLRLAETDLQTRQLMMTQALQQMETARIEANRQTRYLSMAVSPIAPDTPSYPRAFENTILAFLIFSGVYLMVSLTSAILREQVSS
ncbi:MAG: capsule biosynthesis protein [Rhodobacteraceae bacterium]|nr:capsule biosynthesis protein [Paracoccaceae bacterium]